MATTLYHWKAGEIFEGNSGRWLRKTTSMKSSLRRRPRSRGGETYP
jgi:hypothetical protein